MLIMYASESYQFYNNDNFNNDYWRFVPRFIIFDIIYIGLLIAGARKMSKGIFFLLAAMIVIQNLNLGLIDHLPVTGLFITAISIVLLTILYFNAKKIITIVKVKSMRTISRHWKLVAIVSFALTIFQIPNSVSSQSVWSKQKAFSWYKQQGWLAGCNYLPVTAINQLEMWQAESFDTATISKELALAESIGFNTLRVFLHDKLWQQDSKGFVKRIDIFLRICAKHHIRPMLVFFDSCWDPFPALGKQHDPIPGLHNSGWVQSPGVIILMDSTKYGELKQYVQGIISAFKNDKRILCWDLWNEPDNTNGNSYNDKEPKNKVQVVNRLLPQVFNWAREAHPSQPLTSGLWTFWDNGWDKDSSKQLSATERIQLGNSDVITFHCYDDSTTFKKQVKALLTHRRPIFCSEYMARGNKSTVITIMPVARRYNVGVINWGFADGKEQTKFPWDSWSKRYTSDPPLWHHILFRADYTPYISEEIEFVKKMTKRR